MAQGMIQKIGKIAKVGAIGGTLLWLALVEIAPSQPDAAHPQRYAHRHVVRYVSEDMGTALKILLGVNLVMVALCVGCLASEKRGAA